MKTHLTKFALLSLLGCFSLSAQEIPSGKEIAMSKCSKDTSATNTNTDSDASCGDKSDDSKDSSCPMKSDKKSNGKSSCGDGDTSYSEYDSDAPDVEASSLLKLKRKTPAEQI